MNANPLVSIMIPVHNTGRYLYECLDSLINQTYSNIEIICVDDGSTDASPEILKEYAKKDSRIKVILLPKSGVGVARNEALDASTGEWITSVDSDDYLSPRAIENCIPHTQDEEVDMIRIQMWDFNDGKPEVRIGNGYFKPCATGKVKVTEGLMQKVNVGFSGKLWRRSVIDSAQARFPEHLLYEDLHFWYCMMPHCKCMYFENSMESLYYYRRNRAGSTMTTSYARTSRKPLQLLTIGDSVLTWYKNHGVRTKLGYDEDTPSATEISLAQYVYHCVLRDCPVDCENEAWETWRAFIDAHKLLPHVENRPWFALRYNLSPKVVTSLNHFYGKVTPNKTVAPDTQLAKEVALLTSYKMILRRYRVAQLRCFFSFGSRKKRYQDQKVKYKNIVRQCRKLKEKYLRSVLNG